MAGVARGDQHEESRKRRIEKLEAALKMRFNLLFSN